MDNKKFKDEIEDLYLGAQSDFCKMKAYKNFMDLIRRYPPYPKDIEPLKDRYNAREYAKYLKRKSERDLMSYVIAFIMRQSYYFYRRGLSDYPLILKKLEETDNQD